MDASFTSFRSRREEDDEDGRSTRRYRAPTLSALTDQADALQRPSGTTAFDLKNVKGAVTSSNALPEDSFPEDWTQQNDIDRALDFNHTRLTFRANLTTLTEAERRKISSHKIGEDMFEKMAFKDNVPEWLSHALGNPLKETQEPRNADTPVEPYTPPHLDPISPAVVPREYWRLNPRRDKERDKHHSKPSSSRRDRHGRKRERSPEGRHHRHHRSSDKRHRRSSHQSHHHRERRIRHRSYDTEDEEDGRRSPFVDPGLGPDHIGIGGVPVRISPPKRQTRQTSTPIDVAEWVRSTSQPPPPDVNIDECIPVFPINQHAYPSRHTRPMPQPRTSHSQQRAMLQQQYQANLHAPQLQPLRPAQQIFQRTPTVPAPRQNFMPVRSHTPHNPQPVTPILQPVPQRPIQISRLMHNSTRQERPEQRLAPPPGHMYNNPVERQANPMLHSANQAAPGFRYPPSNVQMRPVQTPAPVRYPNHAVQEQRAPMPVGQASRQARIQQDTFPPANAQHFRGDASSDNLTDSGYGTTIPQPQMPAGRPNVAPGANTAAFNGISFDPVKGFTIRCGVADGLVAPEEKSGPQDSVWNPNLANCTATKPRRLTLKQDNNFEEAERRFQRDDMRNSISVVKNALEARNKPPSTESQNPLPGFMPRHNASKPSRNNQS